MTQNLPDIGEDNLNESQGNFTLVDPIRTFLHKLPQPSVNSISGTCSSLKVVFGKDRFEKDPLIVHWDLMDKLEIRYVEDFKEVSRGSVNIVITDSRCEFDSIE